MRAPQQFNHDRNATPSDTPNAYTRRANRRHHPNLWPVCSPSRVSSCRSYPEGAENVSSRTRLMDREYELCKSRVNGASVIGIMLVPTLHFRRRIEIMYLCYPDTRLGHQRYFDPLPNHSASAAVRRSSRRPIAVARSPRSHTREQGP